MEKLRIIVGGYIGLYPTGGATWDYIQYPLGLSMLGHDVYYIEDTMQYPIYQADGASWNDASATVSFLREMMIKFGLREKWAYRDVATNSIFGMSEEKVREICSTADVFINISCSTFMREEYLRIPCRILIDSDPMFTQIQCCQEAEGKLKTSTKSLLESHNYLFSFGENIGSDDCLVPTLGYHWLKTRQPVCLDWWKDNIQDDSYFTSILNWSGRKKLVYRDEEWGQKDVEFEKFIDVPVLANDARFKVVINPPLNSESSFNKGLLKEKNWVVMHPADAVPDSSSYSGFIRSSFAEFSIAKETYVKSNCGWFSCRSACYLAAGKPVVAEETGWSKFIPSGNGLHSFSDIQQAVEAVNAVLKAPVANRKAASDLANDYFDSNRVLKQMLSHLR